MDEDLQRGLESIVADYGLLAMYVFGSRAEEVAARVAGSPVIAAHPEADVDIGVEPLRGRRLTAQDRVRIVRRLETLLGARSVPGEHGEGGRSARRNPWCGVPAPAGWVLSLSDFSGIEADSAALAERLLRGGVAVAMGGAFGPLGAGCARLLVSVYWDDIDKALGRIEKALTAG